jgi:NAD-reducing hydrogenase large subunit
VSRSILIDPVTRIEGHAKITLQLGDDGLVEDARFHVTEFRGFEAFCRGRSVYEMPALTARTCGICPVSHVLTGAKAGDAILGVEPPPAALRLRQMMNLGQILQSHALSFFHLSAPDLLLGFDSDPAKRNVFGLIEQEPEIARRGIRMRRFGQEVIAVARRPQGPPGLGGPGRRPRRHRPRGARAPAGRVRDHPARRQVGLGALRRDRRRPPGRGRRVRRVPEPTSWASSVPDGTWEHHEGLLRFIDANGKRVGEDFPASRYEEFIGEVADADTYLKSPYHLGAQGNAAVGPARRPAPTGSARWRASTCASAWARPLADAALAEFRGEFGRVPLGSFHYHGARLLEILTAVEQLGDMLDDPDLDRGPLRAEAGINHLRGVGVSEAPRGTLFHDYRVDEDGLMTGVRMIIATGHNNLAMNRTIGQIARAFVKGPDVAEGALNRIEAGIRAYDPCLSCSTHAVGQMPLVLRIEGADGALLRELVR